MRIHLALTIALCLCACAATNLCAQTPFPVALTFEEGIFPDLNGVDRDNAGVTFGVPFDDRDDMHIGANGRVAVDLVGPGVLRWQATPFELDNPKDPGSKVWWTVIDAVLDHVKTDKPRTDIQLVRGNGVSSGLPLLKTNGNVVTIDTGAARFVFKSNGFSFIDEAFVGDVQVIKPSPFSGINFQVGNELYSSRYGISRAMVIRNGPACAQVDVYGEAWNPDHTKVLCSYVCSLTAYAFNNSLSGRLTLIAGHEANRRDLLFDGVNVVAQLVSSSSSPPYDVTFTHEAGKKTIPVGSCDTVRSVQFQTSRTLESDTRWYYFPGLPKVDFTTSNSSLARILTGNRILKRDCTSQQDEILHLNNDPERFPLALVGLMKINGKQAGVSLLATHAPNQYPLAIECGGSGLCALKLWPNDKPANHNGSRLYFAIPFRNAEARDFTVGLFSGAAPDPLQFGIEQTYRVIGRYSKFEQYGTALYREQGIAAPTVAFQDSMYRYMGLLSPTESIAGLVPNVYWKPGVNGFQETVFLEQNRTGGTYNQDFAERQIIDYLRFGRTGAWLRAASTVNYIRLNHFRHNWTLGCDYMSPGADTDYRWITSRGDNDIEHDWWRSVRLMARLTGDELLRREFIDHSRIFPGKNGEVMYYRFHVKSLEENALAYSLARFAYPPLPNDPCTNAPIAEGLRIKLTNRLDDWFRRQFNPNKPYDSEGWVLPQGSLLPNQLGNPWTSPAGFPSWGLCTYMDRGVRHDGCYLCVDPNCLSVQSEPYGRRAFHEWLASGSLALARSVLPPGEPLDVEAYFRLSQIGFSTMSILHWAGQPLPCPSLPYPPAYAKQADSTHIWLPPPCNDPGYAENGPFQPRLGDGHLGYPYAGDAARAVILQYAYTGQDQALEVVCTKVHEILAAQRFRMRYGDPCTQYTSFENSHMAVNVEDPGHWSLLATLAQFGAPFVRADYPAFNPEAKFYR